jgi:AraC family transcriptional regulator
VTTGAATKLPSHAYGRNLAANFGADDAPFMVTRTLRRTEIAVTELLVDRPPGRVSDPMPRQDAYMICCQLQDKAPFEYWQEGRAFPAPTLRAGDTTIHDQQLDPAAMIDRPLHTMMWFVPRAALNALADEASVPNIDELRFDPCVGVADETIHHLSVSMLPAVRTPEQVSRLFADYVALALAAHAAQTYGGMQTIHAPVKGGLAPWQERKAKEMLAADLAGETPLSLIAEACVLSVSHFSRAFHKSVGVPPHAWLLQARVDRAKTLLRRREGNISEIALACGFADHSHFTRVFRRHVGVAPATWRRVLIT